jgi:phosphonate transport system substrate-binding protein
VLGAAAAWLAADPAAAQVAAEDPDRAARMALRFGVLPIGGTLDSRNDWAPLLADLERTLGRPVTMFSASSYGALARAIERDEVDIAFLSGEMALEAVTRRGMRVVAQVTRHDGLPGYRAILLVRAEGPRSTLAALLADPDSWRMARGEALPVGLHRAAAGVLPAASHRDGNALCQRDRRHHQRIALAVANGEADIATSNTADFERFQLQFPEEAARLRIIWSSDLIPHGQIVMRRTFSPALRRAVQDF